MPWNQAHAPLLVESFQKEPKTWSQTSQFGGSHKYKQNKTKFNLIGWSKEKNLNEKGMKQWNLFWVSLIYFMLWEKVIIVFNHNYLIR
jgi:hypothetical protein